MKKISFALLVTSLALVLTGCGKPIVFINPTSATQWQAGKTYTVQWTGGGANIALFLIDQAVESTGASASISDRITSLENTGSYQYTVSPNLQGTYKWCLEDLTATNTTEQTCSDYFSINQ